MWGDWITMTQDECLEMLADAGFELIPGCGNGDTTELYENRDLAVECMPFLQGHLDDGGWEEDIDLEEVGRCWPYALLYTSDDPAENGYSCFFAGASCTTNICDEGFLLEDYYSQYKEGGACVTSVSDVLSVFERIVGPGGELEESWRWTLKK